MGQFSFLMPIWFFGLCYAMDGGYKGWNPYARKAFGDFCQLFLI